MSFTFLKNLLTLKIGPNRNWGRFNRARAIQSFCKMIDKLLCVQTCVRACTYVPTLYVIRNM